jgi:hypothetical protein
MANWNQPALTDTYANFLAFLDARLDDLAYGLDPAITTATNPPTNSIRYSSANSRWEKFNGTSWAALSSLYAIAISGNAATATTFATARTINGVSFNGSANITVTANTPQTITFNNGGSGAASGTTFNGGTGITISYNSVGAPSASGANASGTWGISISGNAATATTASAVSSSSTILSTARVGMKIISSSNDSMYEIVKPTVVGYALSITSDNRFSLVQTNGAGDWFKTLLSVNTDGATTTAGPLNTIGNITASADIVVGNLLTVGGNAIVGGSVNVIGNITAYSDERLKQNWRDLPSDFLKRLAEVKMGIYDRKDTGDTQAGVSAQAMRALLSPTVREGTDGMLSVAYGNAALVAAVELAREVISLRRELNAMKGA